MLTVEFPDLPFNIRNSLRGEEIFDALRKKWLVLTPEEWVRQNMIQWLINVLQVPASFIAQEKKIQLQGKWRRFDIVVYNRQLQPWMLIECKAMDVPLSEKVIQQALAYHSIIGAGIMAITNGKFTYAWQFGKGEVAMLSSMPVFDRA